MRESREQDHEQYSQPLLVKNAIDLAECFLLDTPEPAAEDWQKAKATADQMLARPLPKQDQYVAIKDADGHVVAKGGFHFIKEKVAYFLSDEVAAPHRGKDLMSKITAERFRLAKEQGGERVIAHVLSTNPVGLVTKFQDGFKLVETDAGYSGEHAPVFKLARSLVKEDADASSQNVGEVEWEEVPLTDIRGILSAQIRGYVGVDIKNKGDKTDNSPDQWTLIFEKRTTRTF